LSTLGMGREGAGDGRPWWQRGRGRDLVPFWWVSRSLLRRGFVPGIFFAERRLRYVNYMTRSNCFVSNVKKQKVDRIPPNQD
jgi:hypothetical protein